MNNHYDTFGKTYTATRAADPRIVQRLVDLLELTAPAQLLDIGAGTGNYSFALAELGFQIDAVEPSQVMRNQAKNHANLRWHTTTAESMNFEDNSFNGVVMTLCIHHFANWQFALQEASRVSGGGPIVIFAFNIEHKADFWLFDYFPQFLKIDQDFAPTLEELERYVQESLQAQIEFFSFPLPKDLIDHFASADWANPEAYLQEKFRKGISSFRCLHPDNLKRGLKQLEKEINNGEWREKYGFILENETYDCGYVFIRIRK